MKMVMKMDTTLITPPMPAPYMPPMMKISAMSTMMTMWPARMLAKRRTIRAKGLVEWLTYTVLDGIIRPNIRKEKVNKFAPYLLTVFFFIFFANLFGLIPFFPFGANVTGNLSITVVLALLTYFFVNVFGNKHYWKDILWPDVPIFLKAFPLMPIIELISTITKPFALMVRLFANILAGHIVIMVLMALIFIIGGMYGAGMGGVMSIVSIFMTALELLVAYIQAYVFTILSSLFIGMAQHEQEHE